jgi:hypothetical protein
MRRALLVGLLFVVLALAGCKVPPGSESASPYNNFSHRSSE